MNGSMRNVDRLRATASEALDGFGSYSTDFEYHIRWADGYEHLFAPESGPATEIHELVDRALRRGRVLLQSGAGTGKTTILHRLYRTLTSSNRPLPVLVDLRLDGVQQTTHPSTANIDSLLRQACPPISEEELALVAAEVPVVVFVDGLNEVPKDIGDGVLRELDGFAGRNPQAGVIVADRLVRRPVSDRWQLATILPLDDLTTLGSIPFFRDLLHHQPDEDQVGPADAYTRFLRERCSLSEPELERLSTSALELYLNRQSRAFRPDDLVALIGPELFERLTAAGLLDTHGDFASFSHHLHHDLLAARAFASRADLWNHRGFDALTFKASSFDALEAVAEATTGTSRTDQLMRCIYDWHPYASAYALSRGSADSTSPGLRLALIAMLAERRFDLLQASVTDAEDGLRLLGDMVPPAWWAESRDALVAAVAASVERTSPSPSEVEWLALFGLHAGSSLPAGAIRSLEMEDSLIGWTTANVARRADLSPAEFDRLKGDASSHPIPTVRWRAVHALGGHPDESTRDALLSVLASESDHWVLRGALRALVEVAAAGDLELRRSVFASLAMLLVDRANSDPDDLLVQWFARFVELRHPPEGWDQLALPLAEDLWASSTTQEQQERWEHVALTLKRVQAERGRS